MRALLQRVSSASVSVDGAVVGSIGQGLVALVGIGAGDGAEDTDWIVKRLLGAKLWPNADGKQWKAKFVQLMSQPILGVHNNAPSPAHSVAGVDGEVLLVSQFTLMGYMKRARVSGPRVHPSLFTSHTLHVHCQPDFHRAMGPGEASDMFDELVLKVKGSLGEAKVATGQFGANMQVSLTNDGPVTMMLDSHNRDNSDPPAGDCTPAPTPVVEGATPTPSSQPAAVQGSSASLVESAAAAAKASEQP